MSYTLLKAVDRDGRVLDPGDIRLRWGWRSDAGNMLTIFTSTEFPSLVTLLRTVLRNVEARAVVVKIGNAFWCLKMYRQMADLKRWATVANLREGHAMGYQTVDGAVAAMLVMHGSGDE